ncbi:sensor histidine kinase [Amphibacillus cookii]|uniref:sensor histidine kinase n=1 Tax=Amphibacillus cookii TaxID=767787 RepID=UPI00195F02EA|nr:histidine kinase [Amphibacillus cookii]MBM7542628.1 two-component system sensor histidine kinase YesM [Amphibacillus cookii]
MTSKTIYGLSKYLFVRLLVMYHIIILPIVIMGLYLYLWSYHNASEEISRHTENQLTTYLENLNREMSWMEGQQYDLLHDHELRKVALTWEMMSSVERKTSINHLVNRLTSIKGTSAYIEDISIHIRSIDKSISALHAVQDFEQLQYASIYSNAVENYQFINVLDDSLNLVVGNMNRDIEGIPFYLIQIELDKHKLERSLDSINMYDNNGFFLLSENREVLWSSNEASKAILKKYLEGANPDQEVRNQLLSIDGHSYHFDQVYLEERGLSIVSYLPEAMVMRPLTIFRKWFWIFSIFVVIAIVIYAFTTYKLVHRPLLVLVDAFERMENGCLNHPIKHDNRDEFGHIYNRYNKMLMRLKMLIDRDYKQTLMVQQAELKQLQSQINPHFLYNSFFILNSLAKTEDTERIEQFTGMLGEYFKFITRNEESLVPLVDEIKHARMYTEIQNMRFSRRLSFYFDELPKEIESIKVPKLIIQPIIENAYKYGLENKSDSGILKVSFDISPYEVNIIVEDNGGAISDNEIKNLQERIINRELQQELTGLANIHRRIVLTYAEGSGLYLSKSEMNGLKVNVRLILKEALRDV